MRRFAICDVEIDIFGAPATLHIRGGNGFSSMYYISTNDRVIAGDSTALSSIKRDKAKSLIKLGIFTALVTIGLSFLDGTMLVFGVIPGSYVFCLPVPFSLLCSTGNFRPNET